MSKFFINRPIFAWVIAIMIMLIGVLSILTLPIAQYPPIALPSVGISATYPGASAEIMANTVTQVIEQNLNGIDNLAYMSSTSDYTGSASITVTFEAGTDPDMAQVQVQNKLSNAVSQLPAVVQQLGVPVKKNSASVLMVVAFYSADGSMSDAEISDYISSNLKDQMARLPGVGDLQLFGSKHSMRIWLDPDKLSAYDLTISDIKAAISGQNVQISAGQFGAAPGTDWTDFNATITSQSQLETVEDFENILVRVNPDAANLTLGDVADIEMGQESYSFVSRYNGKPASGLGVYLATGANALDTAKNIEDYLESSKSFFPPGLEVVYPYDTTPFVRISIHEVIKTLIEAIILVFIVMYVFLQNFRATLIPALAVPVVLLGTFAVLAAMGYSINTLSMFGMVLAIGLLVDDAIVVVENVERLMAEEHLSPKDATVKSMQGISGALFGIAMVLSAVFVPMAFSGGATGAIFRQFSVTIVSAMILSVVVALIFTPALCATMLKPHDPNKPKYGKGPFGLFNRAFDWCTDWYGKSVGGILRRWLRFLVIYAVFAFAMVHLFKYIPSSFLPEEDQGVLMVEIQLPPGSTERRSTDVLKQVERYLLEDEKELVRHVFSVIGFSFSGSGQNSCFAFVSLKDWSERQAPGSKVADLAMRAYMKFHEIKNATIYPIVPPAVAELGNSTGFDIQLEDRGGIGHSGMMEARDTFLQLAGTDEFSRIMQNVRHNGKSDTVQYHVDVDRQKAYSYGVAIADIHDMLQTGWGSSYLNDFMDKGQIKRVYLQAKPEARMLPEDFDRWYIRNNVGAMVPFGALIERKWLSGSPRIEHYNGVNSIEIVGEPVPGVSSGQAMAAAERIVAKLPKGVGYSWTGLSLQEKQAGDQAMMLYIISFVLVFLCLAALYESWSIPVAVLLVVPVGIVGVQVAAILFKQANDVYFQVGFLTIVGLSAKNAILIVEFAKQLHEEGMGLIESAVQASRMRLRPILMTSFAFILGVMPLALSSGAGSGGQNAIGIGVIGGMLSVTIIGVFLIPLFFVVVSWLFAPKSSATLDKGASK